MSPLNGRPDAGDVADEAVADDVDEQLVAYLDGELTPQERSALDSRLGRDAALRSRLRELQHGWDLLDELPMATPSPILLESTLRMAALEASGNRGDAARSDRGSKASDRRRGRGWGFDRRFSPILLVLAAVVCFAVGVAASWTSESVRFRDQLNRLPVALHVDAYLHASDLDWMRELAGMKNWQHAVAVAEHFGEWDFSLHHQIDQASPLQRQAILRELPIEDQQVVMEAWQRYERLGPEEVARVSSVADRVAAQSDATDLLATMDRYARWRDSLPAPTRDQISQAAPDDRITLVDQELQKTVKQWTAQTSRLLTEEDLETIYQALRDIARDRILYQVELYGGDPSAALRILESSDQLREQRIEAFFLRQMFEPVEQSPRRGRGAAAGGGNAADGRDGESDNTTAENGQSPTRFRPPSAFDFLAPTLGPLRSTIDRIRGPLQQDELWVIESDLGDSISAFLAEAAKLDTLREDLLRSWADETLRRMSWSRSGTTLSERYQLIEPARRDLLDLMPAERILDFLRDEDRRRRPPR